MGGTPTDSMIGPETSAVIAVVVVRFGLLPGWQVRVRREIDRRWHTHHKCREEGVAGMSIRRRECVPSLGRVPLSIEDKDTSANT